MLKTLAEGSVRWQQLYASAMQAPSARAASAASARPMATAAAFASNGSDALRQAFAQCAATVRDYDYENYLWAMQLPRVRAAFCCL